jgi:hypothetical protein
MYGVNFLGSVLILRFSIYMYKHKKVLKMSKKYETCCGCPVDTSDGVRSNDRGGNREAGVLWTPLTESEATTEAAAEKSNLRA